MLILRYLEVQTYFKCAVQCIQFFIMHVSRYEYNCKLHDDAYNQWAQTFIHGIIVSKAGMPYMQLNFITLYTQSLDTSAH